MILKQKQTGFTIVELLIVIVVIGILAAITIVSYNGVKSRANDARLLSIVNILEKGIILWSSETNELPKGGNFSTAAFSGTNCADGNGGWISKSTYACTLEDILRSKNLIPEGLISNAPRNTSYGSADGNRSFMFYPCSTPRQYALYWHKENPTPSDAASLTSVEAAGCTSLPRTNYEMKAARLITLN